MATLTSATPGTSVHVLSGRRYAALEQGVAAAAVAFADAGAHGAMTSLVCGLVPVALAALGGRAEHTAEHTDDAQQCSRISLDVLGREAALRTPQIRLICRPIAFDSPSIRFA
jgi:hypothetical protein